MSTPMSKPTRQQLDELDALLQRMLSLPGSSPEPELPHPPMDSGGGHQMPLPSMTATAAPTASTAPPIYAGVSGGMVSAAGGPAHSVPTPSFAGSTTPTPTYPMPMAPGVSSGSPSPALPPSSPGVVPVTAGAAAVASPPFTMPAAAPSVGAAVSAVPPAVAGAGGPTVPPHVPLSHGSTTPQTPPSIPQERTSASMSPHQPAMSNSTVTAGMPTGTPVSPLSSASPVSPASPVSSPSRPPVAPPTPPPPPPTIRRAAPPNGSHVWNVPLPANAGGAAFTPWPSGIESLTATATSPITSKPAAPPQQPPVPMAPPIPPVPNGKLNVTTIPAPPARSPMPNSAVSSPSANGVATNPASPNALVDPLTFSVVEPGLPFYLWPFGLVDRSCGAVLSAFGPPGRWLGQGGGKVLIGWLGLLMMAGAAAWGVMDYLGMSW